MAAGTSSRDPLGPVVVTGAGGFLGGWLTAALVERGVTVHALDHHDDRGLLGDLVGAEAAASVPWTVCDVTDAAGLARALAASEARAVAHLAALTIPPCRSDPARGVAVNVIGHVNVLQAARAHGADIVLYTSSAAAHPRGPLASPANVYGVTKRAAEDISKVFFLDHGLASIGLRPNVVYGYGRRAGETAAISEAIRSAAEGRPYALPYSATMCFQYVGEVVDVMLRCLAARPQQAVVSDITTDESTTDDLIAAILAAEPDARIAPSERCRPAPEIALDNAPLRTLIGEWPRVSLEDGVRLTLRHHRERMEAVS